MKLLFIHCDSGIKCLDQGISRLNSTTLIYRDFSSRSMKLESEGHSLGVLSSSSFAASYFLFVKCKEDVKVFFVCCLLVLVRVWRSMFLSFIFTSFWTTLTYRAFQNHLNGAIFCRHYRLSNTTLAHGFLYNKHSF